MERVGEKREIRISGSVTLGRHPGCSVVLDDPRLSREHARVYFDGRLYRLEDLGSKCGTSLNGEPVREPRLLRPGDKIRIGDTVFSFALDARDAHLPPEALSAAPAPVTPAPHRPSPANSSPRTVRAVGPQPFVRAFLTVVLLAVFGAGIWGFRLLFEWTFDRMLPR
ncbi:MAG: FHA domain-containing protein [Planctomycetes bacterium]|nr:FHA domain-containing protein [Planctomycetota bacterium]